MGTKAKPLAYAPKRAGGFAVCGRDQHGLARRYYGARVLLSIISASSSRAGSAKQTASAKNDAVMTANTMPSRNINKPNTNAMAKINFMAAPRRSREETYRKLCDFSATLASYLDIAGDDGLTTFGATPSLSEFLHDDSSTWLVGATREPFSFFF
jgi:hypothetical protein